MKKLIYFFFCFSLHGQWNSTITYEVLVKKQSLWGVGTAIAILNNQGVEGVLQGANDHFFLTPSLAYGVKKWVKKTVGTRYTCQDRQPQPQNYTCKVIGKHKKNSEGYHNYLAALQEFYQTLTAEAERLLTFLPDMKQGQDYASQIYMKHAQFPAANSLHAQLNMIAKSYLFDPSILYAKQAFHFFISLKQLMPTATEIAVAQSWKQLTQASKEDDNIMIQHIEALAW